jgi:hypothetical protein
MSCADVNKNGEITVFAQKPYIFSLITILKSKTHLTMTSYKNKSLEALLVISTIASATAFRCVAVPRQSLSTASITGKGPISMPFLVEKGRQAPFRSTSSLAALIYGWDGGDDSEEFAYTDSQFDVGMGQCSPVGTAVAESLSYDTDKAGHLARLAVAFSPPERSLTLQDIEKIHIVCVREDHIEIEAIICEDGGCVSLNIPVKFPKACDAQSEWMEGCVMRNLEELDVEAESTLLIMEEEREDEEDLDELCQLNSKVQYPSWWVPPECDNTLVAECDNIKRLLNDEEFQPDIAALAQDVLNESVEEGYVVKSVRVAIVGPAGICFKVRAEYQMSLEFDKKPIHILDVMYPFGGEPMTDAESLRAAVLGAVMEAEGN